jgi:hypothetical protein
MDNTVKELMMKTAAYIERTQPLIDKQNEQRNAFVKRATQAAGVLVHRGVIDRRNANEFVDKVAADPQSVWEFVEKLAATVPVDSLGEGVQRKIASGAKVDAFERVFFGIGAEDTGMVD